MRVSACAVSQHEGGDNRTWRRKPRAGRRRPARSGNFTRTKKRGRPSPPFHFSSPSRRARTSKPEHSSQKIIRGLRGLRGLRKQRHSGQRIARYRRPAARRSRGSVRNERRECEPDVLGGSYSRRSFLTRTGRFAAGAGRSVRVNPRHPRNPRIKTFRRSAARHRLAVPDPHRSDHIPLLNLVDDVHAGDDAAEHGVLRVEVRLR
jgi:hypothetical protein